MACRVAVLVLLLSLAVALVASPPRAAAARVLLLADVVPRAGAEAPHVEGGNDDKKDGSAATAATEAGVSGSFRGSMPGFGGRRTAAAPGNAARVLGSVPSPGVGH